MTGPGLILTDAMRARIHRALEGGEDPWRPFRKHVSSVHDLAHADPAVNVLSVSGHVSDLRGLAAFTNLYALDLGYRTATGSNLEVLAELKGLRLLAIDEIQTTSLAPLGALDNLKHLAVQSSPKICDLAGIERLSELVGLYISGAVHRALRVPTLRPLSQLNGLRRLDLVNVRVADGLLSPLAGLAELRWLDVPNWFSIREFARLAVALPNTKAPFRSPFFVEGKTVPYPEGNCDRCQSHTRSMTIGKPWKLLCPGCDRAKIQKHKERWTEMLGSVS